MTTYVALLRGIGPMNPNMRNDKLRGVLEELGFENVRTVISSGNVVFDSPRRDTKAMEELMEKAWLEKLGFHSTTIIRSRQQLEQLASTDPFKGAEHSSRHYMTVTFVKNPSLTHKLLPVPETKGFEIVGVLDGVIFSIVDLTTAHTPDMMGWMERRLGKEITTRTWKTLQRILSKMM